MVGMLRENHRPSLERARDEVEVCLNMLTDDTYLPDMQ